MWFGSKIKDKSIELEIGIDIENVINYINIKFMCTKWRNSFIEFNGTGKNNNENGIDMFKQDLYGRMMGHIKLYGVS